MKYKAVRLSDLEPGDEILSTGPGFAMKFDTADNAAGVVEYLDIGARLRYPAYSFRNYRDLLNEKVHLGTSTGPYTVVQMKTPPQVITVTPGLNTIYKVKRVQDRNISPAAQILTAVEGRRLEPPSTPPTPSHLTWPPELLPPASDLPFSPSQGQNTGLKHPQAMTM